MRQFVDGSTLPTAAAGNDPSGDFAELLRDHRRAAGLTQEELAEQAGVSPRSISDLERGGAHLPRRDTVALLARALGLTGASREAFEAPIERRRRARHASQRLDLAEHDKDTSAASTSAVEPAKHNVSRSLTSFVGREHDLTRLAAALTRTPLLTLVGAPGVGKTRLARELVRQHSATYPEGGWLVELAELADPSLVPGAVAAAVGLRDVHAHNLTSRLTEYLSHRRILLVLDNCEHLLDACAGLTTQLLESCPELHVLATSREALAIAGETTWQVLPLELPDLAHALSPDDVKGMAAVRLFTERAQAVGEMALTPENLQAIARICISVDGVPLALELAAARTRMLSLQELADRLCDDTGLLAGTNRAGLPRQRTMRATIDWSHDLLAEQEQILLRRLSVFAGGSTLDMAESVCSGAGIDCANVFDLLAQLVDKSMVLVDARGTASRYRLLEPIRQYALDRLISAGEADTYRARHAAALLTLAQSGPESPAGPEEITSLDRIEVEHANVQVALRWALTHHQTEAALRSSSALFRFCERRGHFEEGRAWLEQALSMEDAAEVPAQVRSGALNALAFLYWRGGSADRAGPIADQALAVSREAGHTRGIAQALLNAGMTAYLCHDYETAVARLEESVAFAREAGSALTLSVALTFLGRILLWVNGPFDARASTVLRESLALAEAAQSRYAIGHALATSGDLLWAQQEATRAVSYWRRALDMVSELGDRRGIAGCLERLAVALATAGQSEEGAWLFGAADAQHAALGLQLRRDQPVDHAHFVATAQQDLAETLAPAWHAGQSASVEESVVRARQATGSLVNRSTEGSVSYPR